MGEEQLRGGIANVGRVVRSGDDVLRPATSATDASHALLDGLRRAGFEGAPVPVGIDGDGRERLRFIDGDVAVPPYPPWAQADDALASIAVLLRRFHDASATVGLTDRAWNRELADPDGGPLVCHNDVCLENVVFRNGAAVALLDFDFAAPGRPTYDLAQFARMCVPIDDDVTAARLGWTVADAPRRLRLVADAYGLAREDRTDLLHLLAVSIERGAAFVRRRVEAGEPAFVARWDAIGGEQRLIRRQRWRAQHRRDLAAALG